MSNVVVTYPAASQYEQAIKNNQVLDSMLKSGSPRKHPSMGFKLQSYAGGFSTVFPIDLPTGQTYALKCLSAPIGDGHRRYDAVSRYLKDKPGRYFIDFTYVSEGIQVGGENYPTIRMEWVEAPTLYDFILKHRNDPMLMRELAGEFEGIVADLHRRGVSHGDLQPKNVLVCHTKAGYRMKLIDYDSFCVPEIADMPDTIAGQPAYQHPTRITSTLLPGQRALRDYFSELVIYLTLLLTAEKPELHDLVDRSDDEFLLFGEHDFKDIHNSKILKYVTQVSDPVQRLVGTLVHYCLDETLANQVPLEVANNHKVCAPTRSISPKHRPRVGPRTQPQQMISTPPKETSWLSRFFDYKRSPILIFLGFIKKPAQVPILNTNPSKVTTFNSNPTSTFKGKDVITWAEQIQNGGLKNQNGKPTTPGDPFAAANQKIIGAVDPNLPKKAYPFAKPGI